MMIKKILIYTIFLTQLGVSAPSDDFVIEVNTNIAGSTTNLQFKIQTLGFGVGYNYNVDCDAANAGTNTATAQTGDYTCNYTTAGIYIIRISDNVGDKTGFPHIYNFGNNDAKKITDLKQWGTAVWSSMENAFRGAENMVVTATDIPDLSNVTDMSSMFSGAASADPNVSLWNTSNVTDMSFMFRDATSAIPNVTNWDTSNVTIMSNMFANATLANPDVSSWDTSNVTNMRFMFFGATAATPDMSNWDITGLTVPNSMENMLQGITLPTALYDAILANFNVQITASGIVFGGGNSKYCNVTARDSLINTHGWTITDGGLDPNCPGPLDDFVIEVDTTILGSTTNLQFNIHTNAFLTYNYNVDCDAANAGTNTATAQTGDYTCNYTTAGIYIIRISDNVGDKTGFPHIYNFGNNDVKKITDLKQWGTGVWGSFASAFHNATNMVVTATDIPDLSNVTIMRSMFSGATSANPNVTNWNTSSVTHMNFMFLGATSAIPNVTNWDTSSVINMSGMFSGATSADPNVTNWNTSSVTNMSSMFNGATAAIPNVTNWDTSNVVNMRSMFSDATSANPNVSMWDTSGVTIMHYMFDGATAATPDMSNWDITGLTVPNSMENMLQGITLPTALYDATLANFNSQITASGIVFGGGNSKYCNVTARDSLINTHGWTITDGGPDANCSDVIFENSFENTVVFKAADKQFVYDFSQVSSLALDDNPLLIATGVDSQNNTVVKIYLRKDLGQLQIRMDRLMGKESETNQWQIGNWQNTDNKNLTVIQWQ